MMTGAKVIMGIHSFKLFSQVNKKEYYCGVPEHIKVIVWQIANIQYLFVEGLVGWNAHLGAKGGQNFYKNNNKT